MLVLLPGMLDMQGRVRLVAPIALEAGLELRAYDMNRLLLMRKCGRGVVWDGGIEESFNKGMPA